MAISQIENASLASGVPQRSQLPAGTVLQVVFASTNTEVTTATTTFVDTTLTATITPTKSTSKIMVVISQNGVAKAGSTYVYLNVYRNGSLYAIADQTAAYDGTSGANRVGSICYTLLDSPATTSPVTYKTMFNSNTNTSYSAVQINNAESGILLLEIAA